MSEQTPLEVDSAELYDASSILTETQLGTPSVQNYRFENGRRYHAFREGSYMMPNDEKEQERLDLAHHIFRMILRGRLYRAPLPRQPRHVLDFGTGTGSWAIDFADEHPDSQVVGIDLSPIQPSSHPPNCRFFVDDVESPWTFEEEKFDYVHGRAMAGAIRDWDALLEQVYANLTEDGWVELQEINQPMNTAETMKERLERLGFVDVRDDIYKVPVGPWSKDRRLKEIGYLTLFHCLEALEAFTLAPFTRVLMWSTEEIRKLMDGVKGELSNGQNHLLITQHISANILLASQEN
ncbi:hypothetical protein T310_3279 [Rasamsonia emersonii CBS 393.64]|uniref:Methyltransferase n=1 Tax=Rasamsonia emersonii (strain ATCC 16479 / CBS 393.64 / IMI 116815) TaxID=1408163 RepID=A0A0F4YYJ9_RASE3|nr:hypothetical protein T310_3279 [Rasamsonia emersonii CBS 393.64]KKA22693.1 hypothetical protein T310_3279 [Rasamsonia emersonii CBS 393.64]